MLVIVSLYVFLITGLRTIAIFARLVCELECTIRRSLGQTIAITFEVCWGLLHNNASLIKAIPPLAK